MGLIPIFKGQSFRALLKDGHEWNYVLPFNGFYNRNNGFLYVRSLPTYLVKAEVVFIDGEEIFNEITGLDREECYVNRLFECGLMKP